MSRASHVMRAPLRLTPGAETVSETGVPMSTEVGTEICPATGRHGWVLSEVCAARKLSAPRLRAWLRMTISAVTFQLSPSDHKKDTARWSSYRREAQVFEQAAVSIHVAEVRRHIAHRDAGGRQGIRYD